MSRLTGFMSDLYERVKTPEDTTVAKKVIVAHQWNWGEFFHEVKESLKRNLYLFIPLFAIYFVGAWMQSPVRMRPEASAAMATVSLLPDIDTLSTQKSLQLWIKPEKQVQDISLEIIFDPTVIHLSKDITTFDSRFTKKTETSSFLKANETGKLHLSYGFSAHGQTMANTALHIADLTFLPVASLDGQITPVSFGDSSGIRATDGSWFRLTYFSSSFMLVEDTTQ